MSKLFFDHLIVFEKVERHFKSMSMSKDEKHELSTMIEDMIHHRALHLILGKLPANDHNEFLQKFLETPYEDSLIEFINLRIDSDISKHLEEEFKLLEEEILEKLNG